MSRSTELDRWYAPNHGRGRPPGTKNLITSELKQFWHRFFSSPEYRDKLKRRILAGEAPHIETYLFNRIYGRPKETVELTVDTSTDLSGLTVEELHARAAELVEQLSEAKELAAALPAEYRRDSETSPSGEISISSPQVPLPQNEDM